MSCTQCELKRAKLLIETRLKMDQFDIDEVLAEMNYRWPGRFYIEMDVSDWSQKIMQRNTVAPYTPKEVYHYVSTNRNA